MKPNSNKMKSNFEGIFIELDSKKLGLLKHMLEQERKQAVQEFAEELLPMVRDVEVEASQIRALLKEYQDKDKKEENGK